MVMLTYYGFDVLTNTPEYDIRQEYLIMVQGVSKKTPEFSFITIIVITCKPCNGFTNCFFLLKTEIHGQILHTEPFLCYIRKEGYLKNKMRFGSKQI